MDRSRLPEWINSTPHPERPVLTTGEPDLGATVVDRLILAAIGLLSAALLLLALSAS